MDPDRFDALVDEALDAIPADLAAQVVNLVVLVEDRPPPEEPQDTLGMYDGVALTERNDMGGGQLPDRVVVYRQPLLRMCDSEEELIEEIGITVVHEIAHHFGISERRLHDLGWG